MAVENDAKIWAVMGQSGTGKGLWIKAQFKTLKPSRLIILDPQDEYGHFATRVTAAEMASAVVAAGPNGSFKLRYVFPDTCTEAHFKQIFNLACKLAYAAKNCVFMVEELSNFTTPSWAPALWKRMCKSGRHQGVHVIGCSQVPADIDKAFLSNATLMHVSFLKEEPHRKPIATCMDITTAMIKDLPDLHFIEWHRKGRLLMRGDITITGRIREERIDACDEIPSQKRSIPRKKAA
jgi:hypothetical protein